MSVAKAFRYYSGMEIGLHAHCITQDHWPKRDPTRKLVGSSGWANMEKNTEALKAVIQT